MDSDVSSPNAMIWVNFLGYSMWHVAIGIWPLPTTGGGRRWSDFDSKFADLHWFTIIYAIKPGPSLTTTGGRQRWGSDGNAPYWQHTKIKRFGLDTSLSMPDHRLPPPVVSNGESQPVSFGASFEFPECPCICTMQCQLSFSLPFTSLCPTFSMSLKPSTKWLCTSIISYYV